jgi:hypothetical protein
MEQIFDFYHFLLHILCTMIFLFIFSFAKTASEFLNRPGSKMDENTIYQVKQVGVVKFRNNREYSIFLSRYHRHTNWYTNVYNLMHIKALVNKRI